MRPAATGCVSTDLKRRVKHTKNHPKEGVKCAFQTICVQLHGSRGNLIVYGFTTPNMGDPKRKFYDCHTHPRCTNCSPPSSTSEAAVPFLLERQQYLN